MKALKEQEFGSPDRMEQLLEDLLDVMKKLDLSIDYLASSVTGQDPFEIGLSQTALGRVIGKARQGAIKENKKMKLTKLQLRNIIQEVINEVEFHGETPAGQLYDTEEEDARFSTQLAAEKVMNRAGLDQEEMNSVLDAVEGGTVGSDNFWDTPAYEKLYTYLEQEHIPYSIQSQSAEHAQMDPAEWILGYLRGDEYDESGFNIAGEPAPPKEEEAPSEKNPPQYGAWGPKLSTGRSKRNIPGPGGAARRMREKITKENLQKIIKDECAAILAEAWKREIIK